MIPASTPIAETLARLGTPDLAVPSHVRTAHDLWHAIQRGEIAADKKTLAKMERQLCH